MTTQDRKAPLPEPAATDAAIQEAEAEFSQTGQLYDAREALAALRANYSGQPASPDFSLKSSEYQVDTPAEGCYDKTRGAVDRG
jgi:hypothetical protein